MERGWKPNIEISPACPRCGSSNTKFCYYNNYSLTQPRYFCKGCRRYWTKGGSLRNVPVGGGCRKTRRGKSVRSAVDAARNSPHGTRTQSNCSVSAGASTSIDLAAVYANFLNQPPRPPPEDHSSDGTMIPSIEFSSFHMNQLNSDLPQENGFFESFPIRFSETQLFGNGGGNSTYNFGGIDAAFHKQQLAAGNIGFAGVSDVLPPLPGEEEAAAVSEGMIWPSSDMILHNHMLPAAEEVQPPLQSSEILSPNFSGLNLEAIFRS